MVIRIVVHLGECPPSDEIVGKHGKKVYRYVIPGILAQKETSLRRREGALVVGGNQGTTRRQV